MIKKTIIMTEITEYPDGKRFYRTWETGSKKVENNNKKEKKFDFKETKKEILEF